MLLAERCLIHSVFISSPPPSLGDIYPPRDALNVTCHSMSSNPPKETDAETVPSKPDRGATKKPIAPHLPRHIQHAITPGNTPSSVERITRKIASNLLGGTNPPQGASASAQGQGQGGSQIVPSYE